MQPATTPPQPAALPPRTESVRAPLRERVATPRVERSLPDATHEPADRPDVPSAQQVEGEQRPIMRNTIDPDSERREQIRPIAAVPPPRMRAQLRNEHETEPVRSRVVPAASPSNLDAQDVTQEDRKRSANAAAADREPVRQPQHRIEAALRARQAEALPRPATEPPRSTAGKSGAERIVDVEAAVTAPVREPPAAAREPVPVRSRVSIPSRRDQEIAERTNAPDPIIHVTIGRVEVRASTPAEPRQKPRPANGATGLEDYLRRRTGRGTS
jgi:hypothetical protein